MAEDAASAAARQAQRSTGGAAPAVETASSATPSATHAVGGVAGVRRVDPPNVNAVKAPPIAARAAWGADETIRLDKRAYAPVRKLIIHHSASANRPASPADVVRFIQRYHTKDRGFSDTGYNYLIDHNGGIYEGRAARKYGSAEAVSNEDNNGWGVVGAHAKGNNAGTCGICLIGNFDDGSPTDASIASLVWLLAYKASRYRIDANGSDEYIDLYGNHRIYPNIAGHRQVGSTACPGKRLYALLPTIRDEVARRSGQWDPLTVDVPKVLRWEVGTLRSPTSAPANPTPANPTPVNPTTAPSTTGSGPASSGTGTTLIGVRVASANGRIYTAGKGAAHGNPSASGATDVIALTNAASGDGYWALDRAGVVTAFGGLGHFGDAAGKGEAADLAATATGNGYWVLMADGGIYPFGDAGYASSPKRAGLGGSALKIAGRPKGDGYWVLMADGSVRAFGAAPKLATPVGVGICVDIAPTPTGKGYWILTDTGAVAAFGDAADKGDQIRSSVKWSKRATHLLATSSGAGYLIINAEGSMLAFGDATLYPSFGGSGIRASGAALAFG